ncbi:MAG: hypothetical protein JWR77_710 [Rhizorhabdus sp.]|nr:hypothetical protein [Rhizorhabdus sp.]
MCVVGMMLAGVSAPASAQEKTGLKAGFTLRPGTARIVLMRPTIRVGAQSTGGMSEPNADWTAEAAAHIGAALHDAQAKLGNEVIVYDEGLSGEGPLATQYSNLFSAVADSVIEYQFFPGNRLPTKKRSKDFQWGVGPGLAKMQSLQGADYALVINTRDDYGSAGRKMLQVVGMFAGVGVTSGVHIGYAGLIDLKTGELVWLNADRQMGGDVRTPDGAAKRIAQLLEGFPGRPVETAAIPAGAN